METKERSDGMIPVEGKWKYGEEEIRGWRGKRYRTTELTRHAHPRVT